MRDKKRYKDKIGSWIRYVGIRDNISPRMFLPVKVILAYSSRFCYCCFFFVLCCVCMCVYFVFLGSLLGYNKVKTQLTFERVTGRKARDLQTEEIGCKCQTSFMSPLSGRRKQTTSVRMFSFSIQI